jgi:UPF0716 family protein affecting phage T7 exclusion
MSYLTSLEKRASFPLRPAEQEEVEVAEVKTPAVPGAPALPGAGPVAALPPVSDMLPRTGEKEKYTFPMPEGPKDNPFDIAFGSRENLASLYAEVVDTTAKQRYEAGQLAEKYNFDDQEETGTIAGMAKEFLETAQGLPFLPDEPSDKKDVLERTAVDTYMLEADKDVSGLAQVVLGESAIDPNSEAAKKLKEQGRSAKKIRTAEDIRTDVINGRLRQGFITQAGDKDAGAQAYRNYVDGVIKRARDEGEEINFREAQGLIARTVLTKLPKEPNAVDPPLVTAQREAVNLISAMTEKGLGREATQGIVMAPFRYLAGGTQQLGDRLEPSRVFDPYVEEDAEMKLTDPLGARARGPVSGGEAERAQFLAQQMFTPVDFAYDEDQSLQTSLTAAQTINDLIRDGSLVLASTAGNFDDLYQVARTPTELLGSEVVADDDEQNRFIALSVKAGLPVDKAYAISRAESRGNPAAFAFNLHLGQYNPDDPDNPRNRTAEQEATLRKAMQAAGLDVNLESRAAQNYYGEDARRALDLATAVNPVAAVQGGAFGEFQVTGKFGDALGYVKEKVPDVETDEQAALTFLGLFKKYPGMVSDDMFARWFQKNPEAQKSANEGDLDALAAQYYGALKDPEEEGISDEEARRRRQQMAVRDSWLSRVKEGSEAYLAGMTDSAREATQVVADAPETPTSDPKTLLAARGTREDDDYFTSAEYVQDRTQVEQELNLNAIEVETGVSTVMTMFSDMGEAPSPGSAAFIAAVEDVRNAKENDPQLYQVVYDNKDAPMGSGYRNVANFLFERKASERLGERSLSDLTKEEAKELRAEARQEAFRVVTSAQTENLWRASFYTSFDYLLGEDEADVFDAMMPRVEVMGRTKDGFVFRQEGNVMAGAAALDAPAVLGQSYNIGVVAGYTFPEIEQAYSEYTQGKRGAASLAFAVTGATVASVAGAFAAYIPFSDQVGIEFVNEVHRAGVQGVAERQNFVEVGLHSTSELFATAMEELLETETGRETLEMLVNSGSLPLPYELTTPARRYVAMVDMARATGTAVGMLGGLVMAVGVPDATDFLLVPKALKTGKRAYQLVRDIDLTAEGVEALRQTGTFSRAIGLRPQMFEHGEARRTTIVQLAATLEDASAKDLNGASAEDVASVLQLVDDVLETSRRQDEADAVFRNDLTASIKVEVDNGAEEVLSFRAATDTPSGEAARYAVDRRLSKDAYAVIQELIAQSKNSDDPRRVELALQLEQRLNDSQLRETVSLSPGQADAALKAVKEEASPENVFGFTKRLEILRDALLLIDPASDGMAIRKTVFQRRMGDSLERVGNTAVENLPDFVDPTLSKGLDHYGPVPKADLEADLAKARLSDDKKAEILSDRDALEAWHNRFKAAVADNSILDPQVRGVLLNDFKTNKLGDRSYRIYQNSDNSRRGNLYRGIVRGVSGVAGDATNAAFGQNILTRAMQGVLAAADARGEAYKKFAVALVDKNKLKAVGDGMTAEEFLAGGARPLRMRRFRYAIQSGTVDGVMQIMLANPVMRRLIPKDAAAAYKATYAASASARMAKRQELLAQQKSPLDLARLLQKEELKKLTQRRAVAEGRGDQALVDSLTADIDAISSPQFFNKVSEWMDASIAEMRAAQAEGRAANLPTLDLPIGIDPAIVNRMDMPVAPLSATRKFFRERYSPAFGFKAEEEVQSRALTTNTRTRRSALERPERMANEVILDQMLRYMAGVDPTDSRVIAEGKVEDFLERRLRVRSIGTFDFESRQVELRAQLDDLSEQIAQSRFGKAVDDLLPRERAQVRSDAFNAIVPLMSQYEAILIFTRSKEELDALLEQARFIGPRFRGEEADPNVILSTLFQDPEFQGRLAKVAEGAPSQVARADVESRLRPKLLRAKMQTEVNPSLRAEESVQLFGEWLDSREDAVDALLTLLRVDEGADAVDETMSTFARAFREIEQSADASEYGRDVATAAAALAKLFERNEVDEVLKSLASLEQALSVIRMAVSQGDVGLRSIDRTIPGLLEFLDMAVGAPAGSPPSSFFSMFENYRRLYRLDQSLEGYEGLTKFLDNLVYDEFVQTKAPSDLVVSDSNLRYLRDQALPLFGGYEELTDAQRADLINSFIEEVDVALGSQKGSARAAYVDASSLYPKGTLTLEELLESGLTEEQKAKVRAGEMSFDDMVEIADASGQLVDDTRAVLSEIAAAVRRQSPGEPLTVKLSSESWERGSALYNTTTNKIEFFDGYFDVSTLIHEGAHAMTSRALMLTYLTPEEVPLALRGAHTDIEEISAELEKLRRLAEKAFASEYPGQTYFYGLSDQDEFIAEIFANQQFRQWLATVPAADEAAAGSVLTRIVEALRSLLNRVFDMDPDATDSILAHSLNVVNDLIDADVRFAPGYFAEGGDFQRSLRRLYDGQEGADDFAARLLPMSAARETSLADRLQATAAPGVSRRVRRRGRKPKGEAEAAAVEAQTTAEPAAPSLAAVAAAAAADVAEAAPVRRGRRVVSDVEPVDLSGVAKVDEALVEIPDSVVEAESAFGNSALLWNSLSDAMDSFLTRGGKADALLAVGSISGKALGSRALRGLGDQVLGVMAEGLRGLKAEESSDFFVKFAKALDSTSRFDESIRAAVRGRPDFLVTLAEVFGKQARGPLTRADVAAVEDLLRQNSIPADELSAQDLLKVNGKENKAALAADEAALADEAVQTPAATKATLPAEVERSPALEAAVDGIVKATGSDEIRVLLTDLKDSDHGRNIETVLQAIDMIGPERLKNISLVIEPAEGQSAAKRMFDFTNETIRIYDDALKSGEFSSDVLSQLWQSLTRYVPDAEVKALKDEWIKERDAFMRATPERFGRDMTPIGVFAPNEMRFLSFERWVADAARDMVIAEVAPAFANNPVLKVFVDVVTALVEVLRLRGKKVGAMALEFLRKDSQKYQEMVRSGSVDTAIRQPTPDEYFGEQLKWQAFLDNPEARKAAQEAKTFEDMAAIDELIEGAAETTVKVVETFLSERLRRRVLLSKEGFDLLKAEVIKDDVQRVLFSGVADRLQQLGVSALNKNTQQPLSRFEMMELFKEMRGKRLASAAAEDASLAALTKERESLEAVRARLDAEGKRKTPEMIEVSERINEIDGKISKALDDLDVSSGSLHERMLRINTAEGRRKAAQSILDNVVPIIAKFDESDAPMTLREVLAGVKDNDVVAEVRELLGIAGRRGDLTQFIGKDGELVLIRTPGRAVLPEDDIYMQTLRAEAEGRPYDVDQQLEAEVDAILQLRPDMPAGEARQKAAAYLAEMREEIVQSRRARHERGAYDYEMFSSLNDGDAKNLAAEARRTGLESGLSTKVDEVVAETPEAGTVPFKTTRKLADEFDVISFETTPGLEQAAFALSQAEILKKNPPKRPKRTKGESDEAFRARRIEQVATNQAAVITLVIDMFEGLRPYVALPTEITVKGKDISLKGILKGQDFSKLQVTDTKAFLKEYTRLVEEALKEQGVLEEAKTLAAAMQKNEFEDALVRARGEKVVEAAPAVEPAAVEPAAVRVEEPAPAAVEEATEVVEEAAPAAPAAAEPKATPRPVVEPPKTTRSLPKAGEKHTPPTPAEARAETAAAPRSERGVPVEAPALKVEDLPKVDAVVKTYTDMGKTSPETLVEHAVARNIDPDDHATTSSLANAVGQADVKAARVAEAVAGDVTPTPAAAPAAAAPVAPSTVAPRAAAAADIAADEQKVIAAVDDMVEALAPENADKIGRRAARLQRLIEETDEVEEMTRQQIADYVFDDLDVGAREALANSGAIDDMVTDLRRIFNRNVKDVQYEARRLRRTAESLKKLSEKLEGDEQDRALRAAARAEGRAIAMEEALDEIMKSDRLSEFEDLLDAEKKAGKERRKDARKAERERLAVERQEREFEVIDEPSAEIQAQVLRGIDKPPVSVKKTDKDRKAAAAGRDGRREAVIGGMDRRVRARGDDDGRFLGGPPRPPGTPRTPRDRGLDKVPKDIKGMVYFTEESQAIVYAFKSADAETGLHEIAHVLRRNLREPDLKVSLDWVNSQLEAAGLEKVRLAYGVDSQVGNFVGRADSVHFAEEVFADGFTQYLREGVAPTNLLENVFKIMKDLLHNILVAAKRQPTKIEISPEMYEVFDSIFGAKKSFTINDMPDAMMFLNVQDDLNNSIIRFGGRLETDLIYEDTVTDRFRQLEMSLDDYRRRMAASGQAGLVGKLAAKLSTPEAAVGGLGLGSRTSQYLDPVSSRVLSVEDRVLLNRFRRGEIDRKALPSRLLPEAEKSLRVVGESAVLAGSLAMKAARLMYGDDASRALRAMNAAQRVHATGGARETEEFSNGLSVLVNDITRRWGDSGSRAIDDVIAYLSGRSAQLLTGSERGKRLNATNVDAFEHFSRMIHDMLWRMDPDARVALTQAAEARLMDPARLTTQDDIRPLSGMWHGYTVRTRASAGEPAKNFEGEHILLSNDYIDLVGPDYAKGEKINIDSHLQDTLGALYYAVTGEVLNDGARVNGEALDLAALVVIHSGGATLKAADGSAVHLNQVLKAANMTAGEALVKGVNAEVNGVMVNVPGLLTSSIGKKRLAPVLFALGHAGFASGMFDDAAKWGFGVTGREYRAFMRYITGQQGSMPLDEIEVAKSVINRFGVSAEFVINERRLGQYYIPKQARDALREQMNQASRQFAFGPNNLGVAQSILGFYNSLLYSAMVFGAVVAKPFYRLASLIDLGLGATSMANARSGSAAIARAGLGSALALAYKGAPMASSERLAEAAGRVSDVGGKVKRAVLGGEDTAEVVSDFKQRLRDVAAEKGDALGRVITDAASSAKYRPEVRPIMEARPDMVFVVNGRPYRASDLRRIFIRTGLYNNMFKSIKATYMAEGGSLSELWNEMRQRQGVDSPLVRMGDDFVAESSDAKKSWNITGAARSAGDLMLKHGLESADAWADLERTGLAVTFMELGYSPQTAARMVVEAVYDYRGSMTQADRSWFNRLTRPFFAFTKNAIHHVTNLMSSPVGRFYARSMAKLPFLSAEAATTVMYEFLIGPYGINTSAMNSSEMNAYYDMRNFLEYGLGDQVDRGTLNQYREILPDDAKDISDKELMDYDFNGWTIRDGYNGYDNVPDDVRVSVRALIASRSKLYAKGQYVYVTKIMQDEKLRQEFVKLGGEMAVRDMPNRRGQASYMYNRYPTIQVPLPILEASTKEAIRLGLDDSIYWMLPDNFVHSGMDEAGAMAATLLVLADEALNLLPGGEPFIGDVAGARAVRAATPLVDVRGYGSPLAEDLAKAGMTIAGEDVPLFVELDPFVARILQGSMIPVANAEDLDDEDLGVLGQIGQVNPDMMNAAAQMMGQTLGVGIRDVEFPFDEVRAARVVVEGGQRKVEFIDKGRGVDREFVDPKNEALRKKPFLVGKSALFFKVTPLGMYNQARLQYRSTAQEDQMAAQQELRAATIRFITAQGRQVGMRTAGSDEDRTTKSIERAANKVFREYK